MRRLDSSKLMLCVLLGHLRTNQDQWEHAAKMDTEDGSKDCAGEEHDASMDSIMDLSDAMGPPAKAKLLMMEKEDYSKMFGHESHSQQMDELKVPMQMTAMQMGQQDTNCPMSNVAYDIMNHGLYFGKEQPNPLEMPMQQIDITPADIMIPPKNPYSKIALAQKRQQLQTKFPFKSSKLTPVENQAPIQTTLAPETNVQQFEQHQTWDVGEEPVVIKSVIPNQNTFKETVQPEQQLLQTVRSSSRQTASRTGALRANSTLTNLGSGVFGERFELTPSRVAAPFQGQRARDSLLRASEVARSLRMREQNGLAN